LLGLLFDHEDGGSKFLGNAEELLPDYTTPHPRRRSSVTAVITSNPKIRITFTVRYSLLRLQPSFSGTENYSCITGSTLG
jgi:hypothetical protein